MRLIKNFPRRLAKFSNINVSHFLLLWIKLLTDVFATFVAVRMEQIVILKRGLLDAENQVDPLVEVG